MTAPKRIVCLGEVLLRMAAPARELLLQSPRLDVTVAGAEANVAVALSSFGHDAKLLSIVRRAFEPEAAPAAYARGLSAHTAVPLHFSFCRSTSKKDTSRSIASGRR